MTVATLEGSFVPTAAATIQLTRTDTADTVDWSVSTSNLWNSATEMCAAWTAVIQADGNFGSTFSITMEPSTATSALSATYTGPSAGTITWSQAGDGTDLRDWLVNTGAGTSTAVTSGSAINGPLRAGYVATYGARVLDRTSTMRQRAHHVAMSGANTTQHHRGRGKSDDIRAAVELWTGNTATPNTRACLSQLSTFLDSLWDLDGGGEPFSLYMDGNQWVMRFDAETLRIMPARVSGSLPDRLFSFGFDAIVESAPW